MSTDHNMPNTMPSSLLVGTILPLYFVLSVYFLKVSRIDLNYFPNHIVMILLDHQPKKTLGKLVSKHNWLSDFVVLLWLAWGVIISYVYVGLLIIVCLWVCVGVDNFNPLVTRLCVWIRMKSHLKSIFQLCRHANVANLGLFTYTPYLISSIVSILPRQSTHLNFETF